MLETLAINAAPLEVSDETVTEMKAAMQVYKTIANNPHGIEGHLGFLNYHPDILRSTNGEELVACMDPRCGRLHLSGKLGVNYRSPGPFLGPFLGAYRDHARNQSTGIGLALAENIALVEVEQLADQMRVLNGVDNLVMLSHADCKAAKTLFMMRYSNPNPTLEQLEDFTAGLATRIAKASGVRHLGHAAMDDMDLSHYPATSLLISTHPNNTRDLLISRYGKDGTPSMFEITYLNPENAVRGAKLCASIAFHDRLSQIFSERTPFNVMVAGRNDKPGCSVEEIEEQLVPLIDFFDGRIAVSGFTLPL